MYFMTVFAARQICTVVSPNISQKFASCQNILRKMADKFGYQLP